VIQNEYVEDFTGFFSFAIFWLLLIKRKKVTGKSKNMSNKIPTRYNLLVECKHVDIIQTFLIDEKNFTDKIKNTAL